MKKTVCELFAGVGGFRLGLEAASKAWQTVWFSQWEPGKKLQHAHDCYVKHFGDIDFYTGIDIAQVDKTVIPNHNLLVGGFPCQDYSVARPLPNSNGIEGKKGVLWWQIRDILMAKKPPFVLLENVDRLLKSPASQRGRDFGVILSCFANLGYSVEWRVVNAAEYGGPQRRRRTFIFAYHKDTNYAKEIGEVSPLDIINKKGFMAKAFPIKKFDGVVKKDVDKISTDIHTVSEKFKYNFENAGYMHDFEIYTEKVTPSESKEFEPITLRSILDKGVDEKYYLNGNEEKWSFLKGAKRLERTSKTGFKYTFSEGAISYPDSIDLPARTMLTSESTLNRSTHVIEDPETGRKRILTPREAEAVQGFPKDWTNTGMPEKFRYFCMGNALVVPMITRMGKVLNKIFAKEK